jgi:hypothetical protein
MLLCHVNMFHLLLTFLKIYVKVFVWIQINVSVSYGYRNLRLFTALSYWFTTNTDTEWLCLIFLSPSWYVPVTKCVLVHNIALSHCRTHVNRRNEYYVDRWPLIITSTWWALGLLYRVFWINVRDYSTTYIGTPWHRLCWAPREWRS